MRLAPGQLPVRCNAFDRQPDLPGAVHAELPSCPAPTERDHFVRPRPTAEARTIPPDMAGFAALGVGMLRHAEEGFWRAVIGVGGVG